MRNLSVLLAAALLASYCLADVELTGTPGDLQAHLAQASDRVNLVAEAEVKVEADRALVTVQVLTQNRNLRTALAENQRLRSDLVSHLEANGIAKELVKSSRYSSTPRPGLFTKTGSYDVSNTATVTIEDERQFQVVAAFVDLHKEVSYQGVTFEHSNENQLKLDVIKTACDKLNATKRAYESGLGVKLTLVRFVEQRAPSLQHAQDYLSIGGGGGRPATSMADYAATARVDMEDNAEAPSLLSGMTFSCRLSAEYRVASE